MKKYFFVINNNKRFCVDAVKLHTALHRLGEYLEREGYRYGNKITIKVEG